MTLNVTPSNLGQVIEAIEKTTEIERIVPIAVTAAHRESAREARRRTVHEVHNGIALEVLGGTVHEVLAGIGLEVRNGVIAHAVPCVASKRQSERTQSSGWKW